MTEHLPEKPMNILIYQAEDGKTHINVRPEYEKYNTTLPEREASQPDEDFDNFTKQITKFTKTTK